MDYQEALEYIHGLNRFGIKLGLEKVRQMLRLLGDPHRGLKVIHIAGTNGKGSTAAMVSAMLQAHGYRVGLFTSPHLVDFTERIKINGQPIPDADVTALVEQIQPVVNQMAADPQWGQPTEFEVVTGMGFSYFAAQAVDFIVLEVGMGGRLDATNVCEPLVTVITNIGLEHMQYLGPTVAAIAGEKAGIVKAGVPCITAERAEEALNVINAACLTKNVPMVKIWQDYAWERIELSLHGQQFALHGRNRNYPCLMIPLLGDHQLVNAATAVAVIEELERFGYVFNSEQIQQGLAQTKWPGRLEVVQEQPIVVVDGAHNHAGAQVLARALQDCFQYQSLILVFGVLADKAIDAMLGELVPLADTVIITQPDYMRAAAAAAVAPKVDIYHKNVRVITEIPQALKAALAMAGPNDLICVCGSLYMMGDVRKFFGLN